jgi:hypothetical protein
MWICAAATALIGLPYLLSVFGTTMPVVQDWGTVTLLIGAMLGVLTALFGEEPQSYQGAALSLGFGLSAASQVLPIFVMIFFHGYSLAEATTSRAFVAHWAYALPHLVVFAVTLIVLFRLRRRALRGPVPEHPDDPYLNVQLPAPPEERR